VLDDFSTGRRENLTARDVEVVEGDLRDAVVVRRAVAGVHGVFHQAALRSVPRSVDDPLSSNQVNVTGTLVLLLACRDAGVPLEVHGDGEQSRDFTYIDNVVEGNLLAMAAPGVSGEVFNIACGTRHSLIAIADAIGDFLDRRLPRAHAAPRAGDVRHTLADIAKAERLLGYRPKVDFATGMRRTCEYFG